MNKIHILLFYKFVDIKYPKRIQKKILRYCKEEKLLGRILIGNEGINGSIAGTEKQTEAFKGFLSSNELFSNIRYKEDIGLEIPFTRMIVLIKDEIVSIGEKVNMNNGGEYIYPKDLEGMYKNKKIGKDFIILDARNDYEYKVGRFKDSKELKIKTFRQFPDAVRKSEFLQKNKDKKIVMYCTGGIRCEKASAFMKDGGFKDVAQLHDGIINFGKELPNSNLWEGKNFVFDKRLVVPISEKNSKEKPISNCVLCNNASDLYRNCRNVFCDKLYISCRKCQKDFNGCCSNECFNEFRKQCEEKSRRMQGRRSEVVLN
jgi:UPF0176 protein